MPIGTLVQASNTQQWTKNFQFLQVFSCVQMLTWTSLSPQICHICPSIVKNIKYNSIDKGNTETVGLGGKSVQSNNCKATFTDEKNREYSINLVISKEFEMSANSIEKCIGVKINGLLGTDFLQNYKYVIDFNTLEVHARG